MFRTLNPAIQRDARKQELQIAPGLTLTLCFALSLAAIIARSPTVLVLLTVINLGLLVLYRCDRRTLFRLIRLSLLQGGVVTTLYLLRFGVHAGLSPGLSISWQLILAFLPGLITLHALPVNTLARFLGRILPARNAFVLASSLKFLPLLLKEFCAIYETQLLRGARILPRDLLRPFNWPDFIHCLIAPAVVQTFELADNIAKAAASREFGRYPRRTYWSTDLE